MGLHAVSLESFGSYIVEFEKSGLRSSLGFTKLDTATATPASSRGQPILVILAIKPIPAHPGTGMLPFGPNWQNRQKLPTGAHGLERSDTTGTSKTERKLPFCWANAGFDRSFDHLFGFC